MGRISELHRLADHIGDLHRNQRLPDGTAIRPADQMVTAADLELVKAIRAWLNGDRKATADELLAAGQKVIDRILGTPAHPPVTSASDVKTLGDLIECLRLRRATHEAIRSLMATDGDHAVWQAVTATTKGYERVEGAQELRLIANERYGAELTLESAIMLRGVYARLVEKTSDEADAAPLVDVVAKLGKRDENKPPGQQDKPLTPLQRDILKALNGRALKTEALAKEVCGGEDRRLYKPGGLKELRAAGRVAHKSGVGHYRPDRPPAE